MPVINNGPKLKDAIELLERLSGLKMANSLLYDVKAAPGSQDEMYRLFEYLNLKELQEIFRIRRPHEWPLPIPSDGVRNPRLLWHGTRRENLPNVLSKGLSLSPPVDTPVHGQPMLGKAIYFSDVSSKAAQYCRAETSDDTVLLLLSEVELGLIIEPLDQDTIGDYSRAWRTDYCMWGKGRNREDDLKDASCIHPDLEGVQM
ncbi:MAG: hypothetical protein LQ352_005370, partial [Teloschistes flavicans]